MSSQSNQPIGQLLPGWKPPAFPTPAIMQGNYCKLEPLDAERHGQALYTANSEDEDDQGWTYLSYGPFCTFEDYRGWVDSVSMRSDPQFYSIVDLESDRALGVASYLRISPLNGSIEVGHIHFSPALQGTIAATEAMFLMMRRAFESGFRRYEWKCDSLNLKSRAAAQRLGMSFEGIFRQATVYKGRNRDTAWFAAIDSEWPALRKAFERWLASSNFDDNGRQRQRLSELTRPIISVPDPSQLS